MLVSLGVSNPDAWVRYAAKYATLPPLPAQLALPAPVWSIVSSTMLLYLQPALLAALAERMRWTLEPHRDCNALCGLQRRFIHGHRPGILRPKGGRKGPKDIDLWVPDAEDVFPDV